MDYNNAFPNWVHILLTTVLFTSSTVFSQNAHGSKTTKLESGVQLSNLQKLEEDFKQAFRVRQKEIQLYAVTQKVPLSETLANGSQIALIDMGTDGTPLYYSTFSDNSSAVSRANTLHTGGLLNLDLSGEGLKVGLWDAGSVLATHQEYIARVAIADNATALSSHATMVLGAMISKGIKTKAKGVAYKASAICNDWNADRAEAVAAAAEGLLLSNHSYGIRPDFVPDWYFGAYIQVSSDWDKIMYNAPYYLMVTASGNAQQLQLNDTPISGKTTDGFDLLLGFSTSKNGINVAAVETDVDTKGNLKKTFVANYSSFGPTDDGRIKPDIAGSGAQIFSTQSEANDSYGTYSGTSMAAPGVTSTLLLLQEYYARIYERYMKAATLKGLVLHSADDIGVAGPDYQMGWGVINAKSAAELITNTDYSSFILEESLHENEVYSITINAKEGENLFASISWTDPAGKQINKGILNDATPALVNDLDLRITQGSNTYYPWRLNPAKASAAATKGDNTVDPFEKINIEKASGSYTITVSHKGQIQHGVQQFSLIVSGAKITECEATAPQNFTIDKVDQSNLHLQWGDSQDAFFEVQYRAQNDPDWKTLFTEENKIQLPNLIPNLEYSFKVRTLCTTQVFSEFTNAQSFLFKGQATELNTALELNELALRENIKLSVYPNPTTEKIHIEGELSEHAFYSIVSSNGITLKKGKAAYKSIDVQDLSSGFYSLTIFEDGAQQSMNFIKN